jgi:hypothetical protein
VHRHAAQAYRVVLDNLTIIECGEVELLMQPLTPMVVIVSQASLSVSFLAIRWYCAAQGVKCHHLLLLIGTVILDDAPKSPHFQLHLQQERPIRVIGLSKSRVATSAAYLMYHPLYHDPIFGGIVGLLPAIFSTRIKTYLLMPFVRT